MSLISRQLWPPTDEEKWVQPLIHKLPTPFDGVIMRKMFQNKVFLLTIFGNGF